MPLCLSLPLGPGDRGPPCLLSCLREGQTDPSFGARDPLQAGAEPPSLSRGGRGGAPEGGDCGVLPQVHHLRRTPRVLPRGAEGHPAPWVPGTLLSFPLAEGPRGCGAGPRGVFPGTAGPLLQGPLPPAGPLEGRGLQAPTPLPALDGPARRHRPRGLGRGGQGEPPRTPGHPHAPPGPLLGADKEEGPGPPDRKRDHRGLPRRVSPGPRALRFRLDEDRHPGAHAPHPNL